MRNRKTTDRAAIVCIALALIALFLLAFEFGPPVDQKLHGAIGQALAREAVSLLGPGGQISIITRDTETFRQPAIDILLRYFKQETRRAQATIGTTQMIQVDPLRPVDVPPGDFFELIRRSPAGHVIVSLLGPPLLTEEQWQKLGLVKPKIVAFCPGNLAEHIELGRLFNVGLLHAAVISRPTPAIKHDKATRKPNTFDQLYVTVRASDLSTLPATPTTKHP